MLLGNSSIDGWIRERRERVSIERNFICFGMLLFVLGCAEMRDYTGIRNGSFGLDIQRGFDEGGVKKDYCLLKEGVDLVARDTKDEVVSKLGFPDKIGNTLDGCEKWVYEGDKISLFFKEHRLTSWEFFKDE